jgi:hypothetical protein
MWKGNALWGRTRIMETTFVRQEPVGGVGSIWAIRNYKSSGIERFRDDSKQLFVRDEVRTLWELLNVEYGRDTNHLLSISGDSGVGKSAVLFGWTMWVCSEQSAPVLWISIVARAVVFITMVSDGMLTSAKYHEDNLKTISEIVLAKYGKLHFKVIVLDGFDEDVAGVMLTAMRTAFKSAFIVRCSDVLVEVHPGLGSLASQLPEHFVCGWSFDDLAAAWRAGRAEQVNLFPAHLMMDPKLFVQQYFHAGGNCRYMMVPVHCLQHLIQRGVGQTKSTENFAALLQESHQYKGAPGALKLHVRDENKLHPIPLSRYVAHSLARRAGDVDNVYAIRNVLPATPVWQEWSFELYLLSMFHTAAKVNYSDGTLGCTNGCIEAMRVQRGILGAILPRFTVKRFQPLQVFQYGADNTHESLQLPSPGRALCYAAERGEPGCFNLAYVSMSLRREIKVTFIFSTTATTQHFNLAYAAEFLQRIWPHQLSLPPAEVPLPSDTLSVIELFLRQESVNPWAEWMGGDRIVEPQPKLPPCSTTTSTPNDGTAATNDFVRLRVRLYVVAPAATARDFDLRSCRFENADAVRVFDPTFDPDRAAVCHLRFRPGGRKSWCYEPNEGKYD